MPTLYLRLIHDTRANPNPNRRYPVKLRVTCHGTKYVMSNVRVKPGEWSDKKDKVVKNNLAPVYNTELQKLIHRANLIHIELGAESTAEAIRDRMDAKSYRNHIRIIGRAAGLKQDIKTHVARHTFAMVSLNHFDWRMEEVSQAMGHASINTTHKTYARVNYRKIVSIAKRKNSTG